MNTFFKAVLLLIIIYFSYILFTQNPPWILIDAANLAIHEMGHVIFSPFGMFVGILGGSLIQILVPVILLGYFFTKQDYFAISVMFFWIGDNVINVSVYMRDAITMNLPLIGGETAIHDWNWLFSNMGLLKQAVLIGNIFFGLGVIFVLLGISLMSFMILKDFIKQ